MTSSSPPNVLDCVDHRAISKKYRLAIIKAIEDLQDSHLRSSVDSLRKFVQNIVQDGDEDDDEEWNELLFMKTLKSIAMHGDLELSGNTSCEPSMEFKRRRILALLDLPQYSYHPHVASNFELARQEQRARKANAMET